jgi:hypothetical protein
MGERRTQTRRPEQRREQRQEAAQDKEVPPCLHLPFSRSITGRCAPRAMI